MRKLLVWISFLAIAGCGTAPLTYKPASMELADALLLVEELTLSQHRAFKPDYLEIGSQYMALGFGTVSRTSGSAGVIGNIIIGGSTTTSRSIGNRLYFRSIGDIQLLSWKRKLKQWYVVSILSSNKRARNHVYRTRYLDEAQRYASAMDVILTEYRLNPDVGLVNPWDDSVAESNGGDNNAGNLETTNDAESGWDIYDQLVKLDELRERGIITDAEFEAEKKELLESN